MTAHHSPRQSGVWKTLSAGFHSTTTRANTDVSFGKLRSVWLWLSSFWSYSCKIAKRHLQDLLRQRNVFYTCFPRNISLQIFTRLVYHHVSYIMSGRPWAATKGRPSIEAVRWTFLSHTVVVSLKVNAGICSWCAATEPHISRRKSYVFTRYVHKRSYASVGYRCQNQRTQSSELSNTNLQMIRSQIKHRETYHSTGDSCITGDTGAVSIELRVVPTSPAFLKA